MHLLNTTICLVAGAALSTQAGAVPTVLLSTIPGEPTSEVPDFFSGFDPFGAEVIVDLQRARGSLENDFWTIYFRGQAGNPNNPELRGVIRGQGDSTALAFLSTESFLANTFEITEATSDNFAWVNSSGTVALGVDIQTGNERRDYGIITVDETTGEGIIVAREGESIDSIVPDLFLGRVEVFDFLDATFNPRVTVNFFDDSNLGGIADDGTFGFSFGLQDELSDTDPQASSIIPQDGRRSGESSINRTDEGLFFGFNAPAPTFLQANNYVLGGPINVSGAELLGIGFDDVRYGPLGMNWLAIVDADRSPNPDPRGDGTADPQDIDTISSDEVVLFNGDILYAEKGPTTWRGVDTIILDTVLEDLEPNGQPSALIETTLGWKVDLGDAEITTAFAPITPGSSEVWNPDDRGLLVDNPFIDIAANGNGDYVVAGFVDDGDPSTVGTVAWVLNGEEVVLRTGEPLDLDGDGVADPNAFIGLDSITTASPEPLTGVLTNDGWFYTLVGVRTVPNDPSFSDSTFRGEAWIRVRVFVPEDESPAG